jgi:putative FmdB family regulatory protein
MPIYEYQCQTCGHQLEVLRKISDAPLLDCLECGKPSLKKKISAAAFRLKGDGWYETDFKTGNKKNLAGKAESTGSSEKSSEKPSEKPSEKSGASSAGETKPSDSKKTA